MVSLLGASWRTGICGLGCLGFAALFFWMGRLAEGGFCVTVGLALLNARDGATTTEEQARNPGLISKAPDITVSQALQPTVEKIAEQKVAEIVAPALQALDEKKVDK